MPPRCHGNLTPGGSRLASRRALGYNPPMRITLVVALAVLTGTAICRGAVAQTISNPVITGFAPDPSIVRVDRDFYLVNSTFEYFPAIPVYHSRDLVNWKLISYAIHDPEQADLARIKSSGGIHASTIRYHEGTYYVVTTNVVDEGPVNFVVTASDPRGPWSAPRIIEGAPGIDPSLLFDDDGRVWYVGNRAPDDPEFVGQMEIWLQELDAATLQLKGDRHFLWRGCCGGAWTEGPHIYRRGGLYYLVVAEGGTAFEHAVSVAVSDTITGPYRNNPRNPVLSHRQLSYDYPITGVGHADFVELEDGRWYAMALGWRLIDGRHGVLGRETFLVPISWETEPYWWKQDKLTFPVLAPASGRVELHLPAPLGETAQRPAAAFADSFESQALGLEWNVRRTHDAPFHSLSARPGFLRLTPGPERIGERARYSFLGIRQRDFRFAATTELHFEPAAAEQAGLVVMQNDRSAFAMLIEARAGQPALRLHKTFNGERAVIAEQPVDATVIYLRVVGDYLRYTFLWSVDGQSWTPLEAGVDATSLSPAVIEGFNYTGAYVGLYATANGASSGNHADFAHFVYRPRSNDRDDWFERQLRRAAAR